MPHGARTSRCCWWRWGGHGYPHLFSAAIQNSDGFPCSRPFGVTSTPDFSRGFEESSPASGLTNLTIPTGWQRVREWFKGASYLDINAKEDGELETGEPAFKILIFSLYQFARNWRQNASDLPSAGLRQFEPGARPGGLRIGTPYKIG